MAEGEGKEQGRKGKIKEELIEAVEVRSIINYRRGGKGGKGEEGRL